MEFLRQAVVSAGFPIPNVIWNDPDLQFIRHRPEYGQILADAGFSHSVSSVWEDDEEWESVSVHGLPPGELLVKCKELESRHYRPVSISVTRLSPARLLSSVVWRRPCISDAARQQAAIRRAGAAIALLRRGEREKIFHVLRVTDDFESMTQFIHRCRPRGVSPTELLECVRVADAIRQESAGAPRQIEDRLLYALLLTLGDYTPSDLPEESRTTAVEQLARWYRDDPSAAVHGATGWLLRQWGETELARRVDETPAPYDQVREWFTIEVQAGEQRLYQTYVVIPAGEYEIGSPAHEPDRQTDEPRHQVRISHAFAILNRELTRREWEAFNPQLRTWLRIDSPTPGHAFAAPNWYEGVRFCRWLTQRAGLAEHDQAYPHPDALVRQGYELETWPANHHPRRWPMDPSKPGFRLPLEAEWEVAARAGTRTPYSFGSDVNLLKYYAWFDEQGGRLAHIPGELRPNPWGLFDTMGNLGELCHDWYDDYRLGLAFPAPMGVATGALGTHRLHRGGTWSSLATLQLAALPGAWETSPMPDTVRWDCDRCSPSPIRSRSARHRPGWLDQPSAAST